MFALDPESWQAGEKPIGTVILRSQQATKNLALP
jgi:hypothetical protein